ncbi:class I poly(R)-hydroxyalkanoic acid synthase [Varunaivibrio sulfuroxidans]|nr:class I poly(R)-hydroxyalkanoic acid synthase [Varunaivibrio sulfuroxidans]WES32257.1 class I poly(R)-hydroxyalkanoic acid synthase [Varunaivibrio sulfuroxidans]
MATIAERSQRIVADFIAQQHAAPHPGAMLQKSMADPMNVAKAFMDVMERMTRDPATVVSAHVSLWNDYLKLWQNASERMMGREAPPVATPEIGDKRFKDAAWRDNAVFDYIKQSYLLTSRWMQSTMQNVPGVDAKTARKVDFYVRQFTDALSPTNFVMTNPEVLKATLETRGENLLKGLKNMLADLERGHGQLAVRQTDLEAFKVGVNLATTEGKVIYRNALMELIQYAPRTQKVRKTPLLIIPPWINKYYILDMRADNSFVRWACEQGHTVFTISWVNPDEKLARETFADYMRCGPLGALEAIEKATGERQVNAIGYCIGGTLLASTLAYIAGTTDARWKKRIKSATYFTTLVDFSDVGEMSVFIDEEQVASLEQRMTERGYLEGGEMATTFSMLRSNDLIWSFVIDNYLLGKDPFPFDLLYWNSDSTRMPAVMHAYYLRNMYLDNKLVQPGALTIDDVALDLGRIDTPSYIMAAREDHIAPWKSTFQAVNVYQGETRFVLSASGHVAGVVNPPVKRKYCYWTDGDAATSPDAWLNGAIQHTGSWWPDWAKWINKYAGVKNIPARIPGDGALKPLCDAPGAYVVMRADHQTDHREDAAKPKTK